MMDLKKRGEVHPQEEEVESQRSVHSIKIAMARFKNEC